MTRPTAIMAAPEDGGIDAPTIILTPNQIALLSQPPEATVVARPEVAPESSGEDLNEMSGYRYDAQFDAPTIVLDVNALLASPPPATAAREDEPPSFAAPRVADPPLDMATSWPRPSVTAPEPPFALNPRGTDAALAAPKIPHRPGPKISDPDEDFARLRAQRLAREAQQGVVPAEETHFTDALQQLWREIKPGLDRVLGRSHRAGVRGVRATTSQTSANLPAVRVRPLDDDSAPAVSRHSSTARSIGFTAQQAAAPAIVKLHSRAEQAAQRLVDRIDEHLGTRPPMQHVLLGPGRMIIAFAPGVSIRLAQTIIAAVQARSLRRLVGYNAYLVLVPPGREARYAERLHGYREVTGVHFGTPRPPARAGY